MHLKASISSHNRTSIPMSKAHTIQMHACWKYRDWLLEPSRHMSYLIKGISPHYDDVIMSTIASQITSLTIVYSTVYSGADQSKHQSSASLAFVWRIHRGPVNSPHKWPVTRKMFPFDDVIMQFFIQWSFLECSLVPWRRIAVFLISSDKWLGSIDA